MRLIDVDNFLKQYSDQVPGDTIDAIDLRLALLKEPTVDAIPVGWIKDKIATNMHLWEEGKDKMFIENGVVEVVSYSLTAQTLSNLLKWWEKENGRNAEKVKEECGNG